MLLFKNNQDRTPVRDAYNFDRSSKARGIVVTREGFWEVSGVIAEVGPLVYKREDGSTYIQYVTAEVLRKDLDQLVGMPVTNSHPEEGVTPENFKRYVVGVIREAWFDDATGELWVTLFVNDKSAQEDINRGRVELSPGYAVKLTTDVPDRLEADTVQLTRTYNHLAIVDQARGGKTVRLQIDHKGTYMFNMDGKKVYVNRNLDSEEDPKEEEEKDSEEEEQDEEEEEEETDSEEEEQDGDLQEKYDKLKEKYDQLKGRMDQMEQDAEKKNADGRSVEDRIPGLVEEYSRVKSVALRCGVNMDSKMSVGALKKAVVASQSATDLSRSDAGYIDGRFEVIAERFPPRDSLESLDNALNYDGSSNEDALELVNPADSLQSRKGSN